MSKHSDRVSQLACEVAISILEENGVDNMESYLAFKASYDLRDKEEGSRLAILRGYLWKLLWKFAENETPNNAMYIDQQLDHIRALAKENKWTTIPIIAMRIPYENKNDESRFTDLKEFVNDIDEEIKRMGDSNIMSIRSLINEILAKYDLSYVDLTGYRQDFIDAVKAFLPEINFALDQEIARLDPGWKHLLMSKRISDMTGYEYKTYLKLIGKLNE